MDQNFFFETVARLGDPLLLFLPFQGLSPLHWACDRGRMEIVEALLKRGADVNILVIITLLRNVIYLI